MDSTARRVAAAGFAEELVEAPAGRPALALFEEWARQARAAERWPN